MKAVAFSGGVDSTALLLRAVGELGAAQVVAVHVHHGLQDAADAFAAHCAAVCERLGVRLVVERLALKVQPGESVEAVARAARYAVLAAAAQAHGASTVLLGQHADDQVETVLLALSRGAGLPGLAAMPAVFERHGMRFERPLLGVPRAALQAEVEANTAATSAVFSDGWVGPRWVDDPSNVDAQRTRNRIRHQVVPALEATFPAFRDTFSRSARHAAQAQRLLDALAEQDWQGGALQHLQSLSDDRLANALRGWLRREHSTAATEVQLAELCSQVRAATTRGHQISLRVARGTVARERGHPGNATDRLKYWPL